MKPNNKLAIAENIKKYREILGISQDQLSNLVDVPYDTIIKIGSGTNKNPTIKTLVKSIKVLCINVNDLIQ